MPVDEPGDDIGQVVLRLDTDEVAGLDQRSDDGPVLTATVGAGKESILSVQCDRPNGALHHVGIDLDTTVADEERKAVPTRERIADRLGQLGLLADQGELGAKPGFKIIEDWPAAVLADGMPLL